VEAAYFRDALARPSDASAVLTDDGGRHSVWLGGSGPSPSHLRNAIDHDDAVSPGDEVGVSGGAMRSGGADTSRTADSDDLASPTTRTRDAHVRTDLGAGTAVSSDASFATHSMPESMLYGRTFESTGGGLYRGGMVVVMGADGRPMLQPVGIPLAVADAALAGAAPGTSAGSDADAHGLGAGAVAASVSSAGGGGGAWRFGYGDAAARPLAVRGGTAMSPAQGGSFPISGGGVRIPHARTAAMRSATIATSVSGGGDSIAGPASLLPRSYEMVDDDDDDVDGSGGGR